MKKKEYTSHGSWLKKKRSHVKSYVFTSPVQQQNSFSSRGQARHWDVTTRVQSPFHMTKSVRNFSAPSESFASFPHLFHELGMSEQTNCLTLLHLCQSHTTIARRENENHEKKKVFSSRDSQLPPRCYRQADSVSHCR